MLALAFQLAALLLGFQPAGMSGMAGSGWPPQARPLGRLLNQFHQPCYRRLAVLLLRAVLECLDHDHPLLTRPLACQTQQARSHILWQGG